LTDLGNNSWTFYTNLKFTTLKQGLELSSQARTTTMVPTLAIQLGQQALLQGTVCASVIAITQKKPPWNHLNTHHQIEKLHHIKSFNEPNRNNQM
jgi:hypothetical protein